jgi:phenylacetate-CoA ligase
MRLRDRLYWQRYRRQYDVDGVEDTIAAFRHETPAEARRGLAGRLRDQVRYFARRPDALPEWREAAAIADLDELWRVWPTLPILTKRDLQSRFSARALKAREVDGIPDATGGSTGEPTTFIHDAAFKRTTGAITFLTRQALGWRPGLPTVCVWGAQRDIGQGLTGWRKLRHAITSGASRLHEVDGFALTDDTARRVYDRLRAVGPGAAIYGFGSMLEHVARVVQRERWPVPRGLVGVAWNGGEMLYPEQGQLFESVFGVPILDYYGGRELGTIAAQHIAGGPLHIVRPYIFLELVGDDGLPVAPGQPGRVVLTSTACRGTPFLRYDVGDLATASADAIDDAGIARLDALLGRTSSVLHLPNGATVHNIYWNHLFKEFDEVTQFQVRLKPDGSIALSFVGRGFGEQREAGLRSTLASFLGAIPVQIAWVDAIPATRLGKRLQVVVD